MKMNWGVKIFAGYTLFVIAMLVLVYKCTQQHFDLVTKDYYAEELKYQRVIDGGNNARALGVPVSVTQQNDRVDITVPVQNNVAINDGKIVFYRPSNAAQDFTTSFSSSLTTVPVQNLSPGLYKVKVSWTMNDKPYYNEQSVYIN